MIIISARTGISVRLKGIMRKPAKLTFLAADQRLIFHCIGSLKVYASTSSNCCTGGIVST